MEAYIRFMAGPSAAPFSSRLKKKSQRLLKESRTRGGTGKLRAVADATAEARETLDEEVERVSH